MRCLQLPGYCVDFGLRALNWDARFEASVNSYGRSTGRPTNRATSNRKIDVRSPGRECKSARQDANHPNHLAIEIDAAAYDVAVTPETALPQAI